MPLDSNSANKSGKKSKRGFPKKEGPSIKEKMEMLYEKVLDDLLVNQEKLTKTERVKLFVKHQISLKLLKKIQDIKLLVLKNSFLNEVY